MDEVRQAIEELQQAQENFKNAAPEFIDIAVFSLKAAELKVNVLLKGLKN